MKKIFLIALLSLWAVDANAQCNGVFQPNFICGRLTTAGPPGPVPNSTLTGVPGGLNGQIQYNNSGTFGGFTPGGDLSFSVPNFTIVPNAVTNSKINPGPANTVKGTANGGSTVTDNSVNFAALPTLLGNLPATIPTSATVTISNGSPAVVTWTAHGLPVGTPIAFQTTGALPSPLSPGVIISGSGSTSGVTNIPGGGFYFVIPTGPNTMNLATTYANAINNVAINTTTSGSGTQTAVANSTFIPGTKGYVYEAELQSGSAINLPFQVSTLLLSLTLPAGVYDVSGQVDAVTAGGALASEYHSSISNLAGGTIVTFPNEGGNDGGHILYRANQTNVLKPGPKRIFIFTPTTINLQAYSTYGTDVNGSNGSGSQTMYGYLRAVVQ